MATQPRYRFAASLLVLALAACSDASTAPAHRVAGRAAIGDQAAIALTAQLQPPAPSPTATATQFRWLEPFGTGGNALGGSTNSAAYLPYLQVDLCAIASPEGACGDVVAGSLATAANGGVALSADGKAYVASFRARDLPLDAAQDYRLRVRLADPAGATVQVGYQDVDVSGGARGAARPGFYVTNTKQNVPVRFILGPGVPRVVAITPATDTILIGTTRSYSATVTDWASTPIPGAPVSWLVADPAIAGVAASGELSAIGLGRTTLYASSGGISASQGVVVKSPVVRVSLVQSPANPVTVGTAVTLTATAYDAGGNVVTTRPYAWTGVSAPGAQATLNTSQPGSFPVSVSVDGVSASLTIDVTVQVVPQADRIALGVVFQAVHLGGDVPMASTVQAFAGREQLALAPTAYTWTSSNPTVASVDGGGVLHGSSTGVAVITVSLGPTSNTFVALVGGEGAAPGTAPSAVMVVAARTTLAAGERIQCYAVPVDAEGRPLAPSPVQWSSGNATATVDVNGLVTAVGSTTTSSTYAVINAAVANVAGTLQLHITSTVSAPPTYSGQIIVTPPTSTIDIGQMLELSANDENGHPITLPLQWTSGNGSVATVEPIFGTNRAVVRGVSGGRSNITVSTVGAPFGIAVIDVTPAPPPPPTPQGTLVLTTLPAFPVVNGESILPSSAGTFQMQAYVQGADGLLTPVQAVGWTIQGVGATISAAGLVTYENPSGNRVARFTVNALSSTSYGAMAFAIPAP